MSDGGSDFDGDDGEEMQDVLDPTTPAAEPAEGEGAEAVGLLADKELDRRPFKLVVENVMLRSVRGRSSGK